MSTPTVRATARPLSKVSAELFALAEEVAAAGKAAASAAFPATLASATESPVTDAQWAAFEFQPIDGETLANLKPPTNEVWEEISIENLLIPTRLAWIIVSKSKDELKGCLRQLGLDDGAAGTEMVRAIDTAYNFFDAMAKMLNSARVRCFSVAAGLEVLASHD